MTQHQVNVARMFYRLEFGHEKPNGKINPNTGDGEMSFVPEFTRWGGKWSISQSMAIALNGANIKDAVVFFIKSGDNVTPDYLVRVNGAIYSIVNISYDESMSAKAFDLITCQRWVRKHG